jgi:kynurenine formamidase
VPKWSESDQEYWLKEKRNWGRWGPDGYPFTIHQALRAYGVPLVYRARVSELAEVCARLERYECQFVVAPLRIKGGTASPVNPLALL